jgi:homoserine dehydrogenase
MVILVNAVFNQDTRLEDVYIKGIRDVGVDAVRRGDAVCKLVGTYENGRIRVEPEFVATDDIFARIGGTDKIAEFDSIEMGKLAVVGGASGRMQMGATLTKEILNLYK